MSLLSSATGAVNTVSILAAENPGNKVTSESEWDLKTFFDNSTTTAQTIGGSFVALCGIILIIMGVFKFVQKLLSEQNRESWVKVIVMIVGGGVLVFSGLATVLNLAAGGQQTINDLGNGKTSTALTVTGIGDQLDLISAWFIR